jgi:hypothetical protein
MSLRLLTSLEQIVIALQFSLVQHPAEFLLLT